MASRQMGITPFSKSQGPSTEHGPKESVKVKSNMTKTKNSGTKDGLYKALGGKPIRTDALHIFIGHGSANTKTPHGPAGEFGRPSK